MTLGTSLCWPELLGAAAAPLFGRAEGQAKADADPLTLLQHPHTWGPERGHPSSSLMIAQAAGYRWGLKLWDSGSSLAQSITTTPPKMWELSGA